MKKMISASLMCADFGNLKEQLAQLAASGVEYLHIDIMDGHFVPNFTLGPDFVKQVRALSDIPLDLHLMVENPENYLSLFEPRPGDIVAVHAEATVHLQRALALIRSAGASACAALNPATPLSALQYVADDLDFILIMTVNPGFAGQKVVPAAMEKIKDARAFALSTGRDIPVIVDGNCSYENLPVMSANGAQIFVGGTSGLFRQNGTIAAAAQKMRAAMAVSV